MTTNERGGEIVVEPEMCSCEYGTYSAPICDRCGHHLNLAALYSHIDSLKKQLAESRRAAIAEAVRDAIEVVKHRMEVSDDRDKLVKGLLALSENQTKGKGE